MKHLTPFVLASALGLCGCPDTSRKDAPKPAASEEASEERQPEDAQDLTSDDAIL